MSTLLFRLLIYQRVLLNSADGFCWVSQWHARLFKVKKLWQRNDRSNTKRVKFLEMFVHYPLKTFLAFSEQKMCYDWLNYICTRNKKALYAIQHDDTH